MLLVIFLSSPARPPLPGMDDYILDDDNTNSCQSKLREINMWGLKRLRSLELFRVQIMSHAILPFPGYLGCNELKKPRVME